MVRQFPFPSTRYHVRVKIRRAPTPMRVAVMKNYMFQASAIDQQQTGVGNICIYIYVGV